MSNSNGYLIKPQYMAFECIVVTYVQENIMKFYIRYGYKEIKEGGMIIKRKICMFSDMILYLNSIRETYNSRMNNNYDKCRLLNSSK